MKPIPSFSILSFGLAACQAVSERPAGRTLESASLAREPVVVVRGEGEAAGSPDRAVINLGASAEASEAQSAQKKVDDLVSATIAAVRALGVAESMIQTSGLSLYPVYAHDDGSRGDGVPRVVGFRASNTMRVETDDVALVGRVIDASVGAGANELQGISFELRNDAPQRQMAMSDAVREAQRIAQSAAQAAGATLGPIQRIEESGVQSYPLDYAPMRFAKEAGAPVQPGEIRVQASVTITYTLILRTAASSD